MTIEERKKALAELKLQKAIDRGIKEFQRECGRDYRERRLEEKFFRTH